MLSKSDAVANDAQIAPFAAQATRPGRFGGFLKWIRSDPRVLVSGGMLLLVILGAVAAPVLTSADPLRIEAGRQFLAPGEGGLLGTDEVGRDIFAKLLYGARLTLGVSLASVALALLLGVTAGVSAAYFGNPAETILMRFSDAILCFPAVLLAMFLVTFWSASVLSLILVIGLLYSANFARIAYSSTLSVMEFEYIEAARAIGSHSWRILAMGILPNIMAPIIVQISISMGTAILLESSLSFLGLGPSGTTSWGQAIQNSSRFMQMHTWGVLWPAIAISSTVLAFNIVGDAIRDRLDPRLR